MNSRAYIIQRTDGQIAFVTASRYAPTALTNVTTVDNLCRTQAQAGGLASYNTYKAIISFSGNDANTRISPTKDVYTVHGALVAKLGDFWTNSHVSAINVNQYGGVVGGLVMTGTSNTGAYNGSNSSCQNWSSVSASNTVYVGDPGQADGWASKYSAYCDSTYPILCIGP